MSISYSTNSEYRQVIRNFCDMSCNLNDLLQKYDSEIDDETTDELLYDSVSIKTKMDEIYQLTKNDPLWINLYEKAAAKFISTNREIGLSILFCYDYFPGFYECWISFRNTPKEWSEINEHYKYLLTIL